ncbi:MAG: ISNCY family transposase [Elusimicrobiota bacterium]|nr:ISNCY family transposase [Elusimicrobiota bacterium]
MEEYLTVSNREIDKLKVIEKVFDKQLTWNEAGEQLSLSGRHIGRLCAKVKKHGRKGIIHGLRGRTSNHCLNHRLMEKALKIVKTNYRDFMPTFANEKLFEIHGIKVSTSALRLAMIKAGFYRPKRQKSKHRHWRERRHCIGELIQLDGSDHDWFEGRAPKCVLLIYIDDATGKITHGKFITVEDTLNLMTETKEYLLRNGRPIAFYVDKDSIYKVNRNATVEEELRDEAPLTQFTRAMTELDITMINAHSAQAKGRVERGFKTHQDRLVKELRLANISDIKEANKFLQEIYIPTHNARFSVVPANGTNAHRPLLKSHKLEEIFTLKTERTLHNDFTVRFNNNFFQIEKEQSVRIRPKSKVMVEVRLDGSAHIKFKGVYLNFKPIKKLPYMPFYAGRTKLRETLKERTKQHIPPKNHPWRKFSLKQKNSHTTSTAIS